MSKIVTSIPVTYGTFHKLGLNIIQCLILQLIKAYDNGTGTEVSNKVIANFFSISTRTVSSSISKLEKLKYISTIYDYNKAIRIIHVLDQGKRWLKQKNGGAINLRFVASYSPYKFYPKDDYRPGKQKR